MYATLLMPLLANGTFAPGRIREIADVCGDWFTNEASLVSFVVRAVFLGLIDRGWNDSQGVLQADFDRFVADVIPVLVRVLNACPNPPAGDLSDLALAYHSSI